GSKRGVAGKPQTAQGAGEKPCRAVPAGRRHASRFRRNCRQEYSRALDAPCGPDLATRWPRFRAPSRIKGSGMDRIRIHGGQRLNGTIPISGAKNATLPLMIASLLTDKTLILDNVPRLADVNLLQRILGNHGVDIMVSGKRSGETQYDGQTLHISAANVIDTTAPYELVSRMRASFWVVAPLVARMGEAKVSMPG